MQSKLIYYLSLLINWGKPRQNDHWFPFKSFPHGAKLPFFLVLTLCEFMDYTLSLTA